MKTALALTTTPAQRTRPISGTSPAQSRARQTFGGLQQMFSALPMASKGQWQVAANTLNAAQKRAGTHKISPASAFVALNSARMACGLSPQPDISALVAPPVLPRITIDAVSPTTDQADAPFSLLLQSPGYAHALQLLASPPAPGGKTTFPDNSFKPIGYLPSLPSGQPADIAARYQAAFGTPEVGAQVTVKLVATSDCGLRLEPLLLTAIVGPAPARPALHLE